MNTHVGSHFIFQKVRPGMFFEGFFFLNLNRCSTIECLLKRCLAEEVYCGPFFSNCYREQGKFMQIEAKKKNILVFRQWTELYYFFSKFSKRTNLELIFTFASQSRLLELLSYGEYNQLFISVVCFWKQFIYLLIVFMYSCRIKSTHTFFCWWKISITATVF